MAKKVRYDKKLLLYGANKLDAFSSKYQVDKTTKKQKYIGNLENYLEEQGKIHQDTSNTSCFKGSISNLESLNDSFTKLQTDLENLSKNMRDIAKAYIDADQEDYDAINKAAASMTISSKAAKAAMDKFLSKLSDKEKKALADFLATVKGTNAEIFKDVKSRLSKTKKGKKFIKEYLNTATKTSKKATSKTSTYHPKKYKNRTEWKKSLTKYYEKKYNLSNDDAKKLATKQMKQIEKLNKGKISATKYNQTLNKNVKSIQDAAAKRDSLKNAISEDKGATTDSNETIRERNEAANKPAEESVEPAKAETTTDKPTTDNPPSSDQKTPETTTDKDGNTTTTTTQEGSSEPQTNNGPVNNSNERLPEENPQQNSQNFQESFNEQQEQKAASSSDTTPNENPVDESADSTSAITDNSTASDTNTDPNLDSSDTGVTDTDTDTGTHTTISGSDSSLSSSSTKKSSGTSPVIPVVAGVAAAGAAGVGAKVILDRRANTSNDGGFGGTESWEEGDYDSALSDNVESDYYESNGYEAKSNDLIEDENVETNKYEYKANSLKDADIEAKEKEIAEGKEASFHDNIAFDAINEAELEGPQ